MSKINHEQWIELAQQVEFRTKPFIDGKYVTPSDDETFVNHNPATGECLSVVANCGQKDVDQAVRSARISFGTGFWSAAGPSHRREVLLRFADLLEEHQAELSVLDSMDMGKRVIDAYDLDLPFSINLFRFYAEALDKLSDEIAPTPPNVLALVRKVPVGVVAAVIPWNYPVDMIAWKVAPALAAGNSVVLKPAEQSPSSALRIGELAVEAGIPPGVLNVVPGVGEITGSALGLHPDVDCLAFTGSTQVGRMFQRYAADSNMKQVWLECGGKSANVVFADAPDLKIAAEQAAFDICFNQGAVCSAHSRVLVEESIHEEFIQLIASAVKDYAPGDPLDPNSGMGAVVSPSHADRIMDFVEDASTTADLVCGGKRLQIGASDSYIEPTIFNRVDPRSRIAQEEVFGPVLAVSTFQNEDEAVALANGTAYALAASLSTSNLNRAHRVSDRLVAGTVTVNGVDAFSAWTPFGGFKGSGFGRDLSLHALDKYLGLKTTWINL